LVLQPFFIFFDFSITNATLYLFFAFFLVAFIVFFALANTVVLSGHWQLSLENLYEFLF
jgi:hypothetical protein